MAQVSGSQGNDSRQGLAGPTFLRMLFYVPFVMITSAWAITAAAETVPEADLLVISEIHDTVWGDQSWDMPIASRETAAKVFDSVLSRVESPAAAALVWELRADFFRIIGDHGESMQASRVIYDRFPKSDRVHNAAAELIDRPRAMGDSVAMLAAAKEQLSRTEDPERVIQLTAVIAEAYRGEGDWTLAEDALGGLIDHLPGHTGSIEAALLRLAGDAAAVGNHSASREILLGTYRAMPPEKRSPALYGNLAAASILCGRPDEAVHYHEEAIDRFPADPRRASHEFSLGVLLHDLGWNERAGEYFQAVIDSKQSFDCTDQMRDVAQSSLQQIASLASRHEAPTTRQWFSWQIVLMLLNAGFCVVLVAILLRRHFQHS